MKRGDLYMVNFEPSVSGEPARTRPAVLLTNDLANETLPRLVVAPVISNTSREYPVDVMLPQDTCGLNESSRIQLNYVRELNRNRIGSYLGGLTKSQLTDLDAKLKVHLGLS